MPNPIEATATEKLPQQSADAGQWKLVEDAPSPELPPLRDRVARARGMALILMGGGLFWAAVIWAVVRFH